MSSLYTLTGEYLQLMEMMEEEPDSQAIKDTLECIDAEIEAKAEGYIQMIKLWESDNAGIDSEIKRLQEIKARNANGIDRLKKHLFDSMQVTGKKKFNAGAFKLAIQKNGGKAPLIVNPNVKAEDVDKKFQTVKTTFNNEAIRDAIKNGEDVAFAHIGESGYHLSIR